ncbi:MAG TPA: hypothetical protein PKU89_02500 [Kiritimatiellia bacterium]|nr:hypothetical protein [Kiritimatiellia bacterium]
MGLRLAAVAPKGQGHAAAAGAGFEIGKVELEQVVARDHVRIAQANEANEFFQHGLFVQIAAVQDLLPALAVGEGDGQDAVFFAIRVGKFAAGRAIGFDIEEKEIQIGQQQVAERGAAGVEHELLDGITQDEIGCRRVGKRAPG